jgi:tetratricopeptide (TPR) repeat protein
VVLAASAKLIGRDAELGLLAGKLDAAHSGSGSTVVICGETGIGKTRLLDEFSKSSGDARMLRGSCIPEVGAPLLPFREALRSGGLDALLAEGLTPRLECLYLMSTRGLLLAKAEREKSALDADIFTSMLSAVEGFVKDSLRRFSGKETGDQLNSMGYGDFTVLLQRGERCTLAAILSGQGNEFLIEDLRGVLGKVHDGFGEHLRDWDGVLATVSGIEEPLNHLLRSGKYDGIDFARDDPGLRRSNLLENVTRGVLREGAAAPICIMLEDLQWADSSSLALIHYLSRNTRGGRVIMIGTYRPEDLLPSADGSEHPLLGVLRTMGAESLVSRLELGRLGPEDVAGMVRAVLDPSDLPPEFIRQVRAETDGNPMYVMELLRLLAQEGAVFNDGGVWRTREVCATCTPSRINEVVMRRLGRLTQEQRDILDCAAVEGSEFSSEVLAPALGMDRLRLLRALKELEERHRLVRPTKRGYIFDQTRVREVLYAGLGPELKKEYHKRIAGAIERAYEGKIDPVVDELALHYLKSNDAPKALPLLVRAGDAARGKYANSESLRYYEAALELMGDDPARAEDAAGILEHSGDVLDVTGQFDRAAECFRRAHEILSKGTRGGGEAAPQLQARLLRRMAEVLEKKGDFDSADKALETALAALDNCEGAERGRALLDRGLLRWKKGDYDWAALLSTEALHELELGGEDDRDQSKAHNVLGLIAQSRGDYDGALKEFGQSLEIDTRTGDLRSAITTNNNIGVARWNKDDYDIAAGIFERNLGLIEKVGDQHALANTYNNLGLIHWNRGLYAPAREWHLRSLAVRERIGDSPGIAASRNNLGLVCWGLGEYEAALENFRQCLGMRRELGDRAGTAVCLNNIGNIMADRSNYDEALKNYKESLAMMTDLGDLQGIAIGYNNLGDLSSRLGRPEEAFDYHMKSVKILESIGDKQGVAVAYNNIGNLYIEKGDYDRTLEYFEKSREIIEKIGDEKGLAVALNNLGDLWFYKGQDDRAVEYYLQSAAISERTGDRRVTVENLCGLAEANLRKGLLDEAAKYAGQGYDISRAVGLRDNEGWSVRILGRVYGRQGKWLRCMELLGEGVRIYREIGLEAEEGDALMEIGEAYLEKGDIEKAGEFLGKAQDIFQRRGMAAKAEKVRVHLEKMGLPGAAVERD